MDIGAERVKLQNVIKSQTFEGAGEGGGYKQQFMVSHNMITFSDNLAFCSGLQYK